MHHGSFAAKKNAGAKEVLYARIPSACSRSFGPRRHRFGPTRRRARLHDRSLELRLSAQPDWSSRRTARYADLRQSRRQGSRLHRRPLLRIVAHPCRKCGRRRSRPRSGPVAKRDADPCRRPLRRSLRPSFPQNARDARRHRRPLAFSAGRSGVRSTSGARHHRRRTLPAGCAARRARPRSNARSR